MSGIEAEDAVGERVAMVVVVEEPGVEAGIAQGGLNCGDIHGGDCIATVYCGDGSSNIVDERPALDRALFGADDLRSERIEEGTDLRGSHIYEDPHISLRHFILHYGDMTDSTSLIHIVQKVRADEIYNLAAIQY